MMDKEQFVKEYKRLRRQLQQRWTAVYMRKRPEQHYQNKRREFIELIDRVLKEDWFTMPGENTMIYRFYHDTWDE